MKKYRLIIIIVLLLVAAAVVVVIKGSKNSTIDSPESSFGIKDTAAITRIFLADMRDHKVTLKRGNDGTWSVNEKNKASMPAIHYFLKTLHDVEVKDVVPKKAHNTIVALLATSAIKIEIYQRVYFIDLFNIRLFPREKCTKTYYVGTATQDNTGTYMLVEGSETPYITHIPGFRGYLSPRYSCAERDWIDHSVFNNKYNDIRTVSADNYDKPDQSFRVVKSGPRSFELYTLHGNSPVMPYDTARVMDYFTSFENLRYEALLDDMTKKDIDSLTAKPYMMISVEDMAGNISRIKTFHKSPVDNPLMGEDTLQYDGDRLYALIDNDKDFVLIQFFVFGPVFRTLDYFTGKAVPGKEITVPVK